MYKSTQLDEIHADLFGPPQPSKPASTNDEFSAERLKQIDLDYEIECDLAEGTAPKLLLSDRERSIARSRAERRRLGLPVADPPAPKINGSDPDLITRAELLAYERGMDPETVRVNLALADVVGIEAIADPMQRRVAQLRRDEADQDRKLSDLQTAHHEIERDLGDHVQRTTTVTGPRPRKKLPLTSADLDALHAELFADNPTAGLI